MGTHRQVLRVAANRIIARVQDDFTRRCPGHYAVTEENLTTLTVPHLPVTFRVLCALPLPASQRSHQNPLLDFLRDVHLKIAVVVFGFILRLLTRGIPLFLIGTRALGAIGSLVAILFDIVAPIV